MPVVDIWPVATDFVTADASVSGQPTAHEALADESEGSYIRVQSTDAAQGVGVTMDSPSLPADAVIRAVRVVARLSVDQAPDPFLWEVYGWANTSVALGDVSNPVTLASPWRTERPDGEPWTQDDLGGDYLGDLLLDAYAEGDPYDCRAFWARFELEYNEPPTVALTAPTGTVTDTSQPTVAWDYTDPENDSQSAYEVRVYDEADVPASAPDDPDDIGADPVYTSGTVNTGESADGEHEVVEALDDGTTYRVYVRVQQQWSGPDVWSAWDSGTFTLDLATPAAPDVVLAPDPANGRMLVEVSPGTGGDEDAEWFRIEWQDGGTWKDLRGGEDDDRGHPVWFAGDPSTGGTAADWWASFNVARTYRVRGYYEEPGGNQIAGPATQVSATVATSARWLTDARDPDRLHTRVHLSSHDRTFSGRTTVHQPAGMDVHVVESEPTLRRDQVTLHSLDQDEHDKLATAVGSTRTLVFRDRRETVFVRWSGDRSRSQRSHDGVGVDDWSGTWVEVSRPDPLT